MTSMTDTDRSTSILSLRPALSILASPHDQATETFQNQTLRPILKLQNNLLLYRFKTDNLVIKSHFDKLDIVAKEKYIEQRLKTDKKLQKELIGMVTGLFTLAEYEYYCLQQSEVNRRIITMLSKRVTDHYKQQLLAVKEW